MKDKEKRIGDRDWGMMKQRSERRTSKGGRIKSAKTRSGQFRTITIVFIAPEMILTFLRDAEERNIRALSTSYFSSLCLPAPSICSVVFFEDSLLLISRRNSDRLAYIPP